MKIHLLNTGFCAADEQHLLRGTAHRATTAAAICALLEHPTQGLVLFDTGYAPRWRLDWIACVVVAARHLCLGLGRTEQR